MADITIGVPVYNGAQLLEQCLRCLERQTYRNFLVRISDNASDDATPDIARRFAARDSRFHYVRRPGNVGAMQNFRDVLEAARTPYFLWRADDDLTDDRYLETLRRLLEASPAAELAVGVTRRLTKDGALQAVHAPPGLAGPDLWRIRRLLLSAPPSWFYGLWRREAAVRNFDGAWSAYPQAWSHDNLTLFPTLIDQKVVWSREAVFIQRRAVRAYDFKPRFPPERRAQEMIRLRRQFYAGCQSILDERPMSRARRAALDLMAWTYASRRLYKIRRYVRDEMRARLIRLW